MGEHLLTSGNRFAMDNHLSQSEKYYYLTFSDILVTDWEDILNILARNVIFIIMAKHFPPSEYLFGSVACNQGVIECPVHISPVLMTVIQ